MSGNSETVKVERYEISSAAVSLAGLAFMAIAAPAALARSSSAVVGDFAGTIAWANVWAVSDTLNAATARTGIRQGREQDRIIIGRRISEGSPANNTNRRE